MPEERRGGFFKPEEGSTPLARVERLNRKLKDVVAHAYRKTPAFKAKMDQAGAELKDIQTIDDLSFLPVTEKADLVALQGQDPPFGGLVSAPRQKLRRVFVSPGPIYEPWPMDYEDDRWAEALFGAGFREGDTAVITFSFHMAPFGFMLDASLKKLGCVSMPTGVGNTELQIDVLRNLKVEAFCGTPSFLKNVAQRALELGLDPLQDLNLSVGFVAAEMLPESLRQDLEKTFGMIIRQAYGTADVGCLGYECYHKNGMHFPEECIVEIVDPETGRRLGPGQTGEVVATNFDQVYPLIRFGTGDLSSYTEEPCPCGRTSFKLTRIMGRVDQVTKVKGMFIHPGQVDQVAAKFPALAAWRVVVTRREHQDVMTFQAEVKDEAAADAALKDGLKAAMQDILRLKGEVEFAPRGTIPQGAKKVEDERVWD